MEKSLPCMLKVCGLWIAKVTEIEEMTKEFNACLLFVTRRVTLKTFNVRLQRIDLNKPLVAYYSIGGVEISEKAFWQRFKDFG